MASPTEATGATTVSEDGLEIPGFTIWWPEGTREVVTIGGLGEL